MQTDGRAFLDRPAARVVAALVILLCGVLLAYVHRGDLSARDRTGDVGGAESMSADPAASCIEQRFAEIDAMVEEGVADSGQAALFKQRAEAMCRATTGDGSGQALPLPVE
ncbi:MAG: hypothetical protein ACR2P3_00020 [Geminicoccaceae bacterium]